MFGYKKLRGSKLKHYSSCSSSSSSSGDECDDKTCNNSHIEHTFDTLHIHLIKHQHNLKTILQQNFYDVHKFLSRMLSEYSPNQLSVYIKVGYRVKHEEYSKTSDAYMVSKSYPTESLFDTIIPEMNNDLHHDHRKKSCKISFSYVGIVAKECHSHGGYDNQQQDLLA